MVDRAADDHISELTQLITGRSHFDAVWRQVSRVAAPDAQEFSVMGGASPSSIAGLPQTPVAAIRSKEVYDVTAINSVDRLASGIEALVSPQSEYWHGYKVKSIRQSRHTDVEKLWFQELRNFMFEERYDADSGFVAANQTMIRRCITFGNAFMWVNEGFDSTAILRYSYLPLPECYIAVNQHDVMDKFYRFYELTARQAVDKFKGQCPAEIVRAAANPRESERKFRFVQCIHPSSDYNEGRSPFAFKSTHVAYDQRKVVGTRGYYEMPVIDFRWLPEGGPYGEGPVMKVLAEIQSANELARNELLASQQATKPPLLVANAGVMNRPNYKPGSLTYGGISPSGQRLVEPLFSGQRLDFATMVLEAKKNAIRESMYLNLFALLVQNPQMSATEALIRANEKAELLGPAGSRFQAGYSRMINRELGIMSRRGLFDADSQFRVPDSLQQGKLNVQFTSPLDRLRRAKEGEGIARMLELIAPIAQVDPEIVDNIDGDATLRQMRDILGAPVDVLRTPEAVAERRAQRAETQAQMANAQIAAEYAKAGAQGSAALVNAQEAGAL